MARPVSLSEGGARETQLRVGSVRNNVVSGSTKEGERRHLTAASAEFTDKSSLALKSVRFGPEWTWSSRSSSKFQTAVYVIILLLFLLLPFGYGGRDDGGRQTEKERQTNRRLLFFRVFQSFRSDKRLRVQLSSSRELPPLTVHWTFYRSTFSSKMGGGWCFTYAGRRTGHSSEQKVTQCQWRWRVPPASPQRPDDPIRADDHLIGLCQSRRLHHFWHNAARRLLLPCGMHIADGVLFGGSSGGGGGRS